MGNTVCPPTPSPSSTTLSCVCHRLKEVGKRREDGHRASRLSPSCLHHPPNWSLPFAKAHGFGEYTSLTNYFLPQFNAMTSCVVCHLAPRGQDSQAQHGSLWEETAAVRIQVNSSSRGLRKLSRCHGNSESVLGTCLVPCLAEVRKFGPLSSWG